MSKIYYTDAIFPVYAVHGSQNYCEPIISNADKKILRELAKQYAQIAALPVHKEKKALWSAMNNLERARPMLWINEVCWHEMNVDGELDILTTSEFAQRLETELRRTIYQWRHMPCDTVLDPVINSPMIITNTGIGIKAESDVGVYDQRSDIVTQHFHAQIKNEDDIEKIKDPIVTHHADKTLEFKQAYEMLFDGIIDVKVKGCPGFWFAPWDDIVTFTGVEEVLTDLVLRPNYVHKLVGRLTDAYLHALDQYEAQDLVYTNNSNARVGSGAYGYCNGLKEDTGESVKASEIWGSATPQIFGAISPAMHKEFALDYERKWLKKFKLSYYGCCEPVHNKIEILKEIPNLRKISLSPWVNDKRAAEQMMGKYVASLKPNSSFLARETWDLDAAREDLKKRIKDLQGLNMEIIIKDVSTVQYQPQRLWQWTQMASEVIKDCE